MKKPAGWARRLGGIGAVGVVLGIIVIGLRVWTVSAEDRRFQFMTHQVKAKVHAREISRLAVDDIYADVALPSTVLAYFDDPRWDISGGIEMFNHAFNDLDTDEIRVGPHSLTDVIKRRVTRAELLGAVVGSTERAGAWEAFRSMGFCHDPRAWTSHREVITFWIAQPSDPGRDAVILCLADYSVWWVGVDELRSRVDASDAIAAELGMDTAPAELRAWCR